VPYFEAIPPTVAEIWRYFELSRWRPPPSWILNFLKILTVGRLKRTELSRRAKFGRNRPKRGRDYPTVPEICSCPFLTPTSISSIPLCDAIFYFYRGFFCGARKRQLLAFEQSFTGNLHSTWRINLFHSISPDGGLN